MSIENILKGFKWMSLVDDEEDSLKTGSYSFDLSFEEYADELKDSMDMDLELGELTLDFNIIEDRDYLKITGSLDLESNDEDVPASDIYNQELDRFVEDLKVFLKEKYLVDLSVFLATESVILSGKLFDKEKMAITENVVMK